MRKSIGFDATVFQNVHKRLTRFMRSIFCVFILEMFFWVNCEDSQNLYYWEYFSDIIPGYPAPRQFHTLAGSDSPVLFGGLSDSSGPLNDSYHFINGSWNALLTTGEPPSPRSEHSAGLIGDSMVVHGGWGRVELFPPGCAPSAPCPVLGVLAEVFGDTRILHLPTSVWRALPARPVEPAPRRGACAAVAGTAMYLFGGHSSTRQARPEAESFVGNQLYR